MATPAWAKKTAGLFRKVGSSADSERLRAEMGDVIAAAVEKKTLDPVKASALARWLDVVEAWAGPDAVASPEALAQWAGIYDEGRRWAPPEVLAAVLAKLPKGPAAALDWGPFILACREVELLDVLVKRRHLRKDDVARLAVANTELFYLSPVLDVAIEQSWLPQPGLIWDLAAAGRPRTPGLLPPEEVVVACYGMWPGDESDTRMSSLLASAQSKRQTLLRLLLRHRPVAYRVCRHMTSAPRTADDGAAGRGSAKDSWVSICETEVARGSPPTATTAATVLAAIRVAELLDGATRQAQDSAAEDRPAPQASERLALRALRAGEEGDDVGDAALLVTAKQLYRAVQHYLQTLPLGLGDSDVSPERALRHERYLGTRQVIHSLLGVMHDERAGESLLAAVETALFNSGVREFGEVGETVAYDGTLHEGEEPGFFADDPVVITRPGRALGGDEDRIIVVKARVRHAEAGGEGQPVEAE